MILINNHVTGKIKTPPSRRRVVTSKARFMTAEMQTLILMFLSRNQFPLDLRLTHSEEVFRSNTNGAEVRGEAQ